jgi:hypothetical protein
MVTLMLFRSVQAAVFAAVTIGATPALAQQVVELPARDRMLPDRATPVFSVGREEGESWEMFSGVRALAFDAADNLYVLDTQSQRVVVFDGRGRFLRQFGKRGGGPGELQVPLGIAATRDGNIVVSDVGNRAWIIFTPMGKHVRNVPFEGAFGFPSAMYADPRGDVVVRSSGPLAEPGSGPRTSSITRQPLQASGNAATLFTLAVPAPRVSEQGGDRGGATRRMVVSIDPVFAARPTFGPLPDGGIAVHHDAEYAVKVVDAGGRHVRTLSRSFSPKKVTRRDQQAWEARQRDAGARGAGVQTVIVSSTAGGASFGGTGGQGSGTAVLPIEPTFAEYMSVVTSIATDPQGRVWVQRRNRDDTERGPIDLLTAAGRYIGTLPPQQMPGAVSRSGLAAYVERDDLGVERVVVRRLPQSWR